MKQYNLADLGIACQLLNPCDNAQELIYYAMHNCYSEESINKEIAEDKYLNWTQEDFGNAIVKHLMPFGHYGPIEEGHQFMFAVAGAPHSLAMQLRTHRIGITFDVQSQRYTSQRVIDVANQKLDAEDVFYFRPIGDYTSRDGKRYTYDHLEQQEDAYNCFIACEQYKRKIDMGFSEEHAREMLPQCIRQNFTFSANLRTLLHLDNMRNKGDAQLEVRTLMQHINVILQAQAPQIMNYWNNKAKHILAP